MNKKFCKKELDFLPGQPNGIIAYTSPFRLVYKDDQDAWTASIEDINKRSYDYAKLHRISTSIGFNLPNPLCVHITYDGTLILPNIKAFSRPEDALVEFNEFLGHIVIGGIFFEQIGAHDLDLGLIHDTGYVRTFGISRSFAGELRNTIKAKLASPRHSISLLKPKFVTAWEIHKAFNEGKEIFDKIELLSPLFVFYGITAFIKRNWVETVNNLWVSVEQIVSHLWKEHILDNDQFNIPGRKSFLKDFRAWTVANQIELLFQKGVLDEKIYSLLNRARKSRNALVHDGSLPDRESSETIINGFFKLISLIANKDFSVFENYLSEYREQDPSPKPIQPSKPRPVRKGEGYWLGPLPPLPGEKGWGDRDFDQVIWESGEEK